MIGSTFWEEPLLATYYGEKHGGWLHILGKINMICSSFCKKKHDCNTFWKKTWLRHILEKNDRQNIRGKTWLQRILEKTLLQFILCKLVEDQHWHLAQKAPIRRIAYPLKYKCCIHREGRMVFNNHSKMYFWKIDINTIIRNIGKQLCIIFK